MCSDEATMLILKVNVIIVVIDVIVDGLLKRALVAECRRGRLRNFVTRHGRPGQKNSGTVYSLTAEKSTLYILSASPSPIPTVNPRTDS